MTFSPPVALGVLSVEPVQTLQFSAAESIPTPGLRPAYSSTTGNCGLAGGEMHWPTRP